MPGVAQPGSCLSPQSLPHCFLPIMVTKLLSSGLAPHSHQKPLFSMVTSHLDVLPFLQRNIMAAVGYLANGGSRSWCLEAEFQDGILTMPLWSPVLLGQTAHCEVDEFKSEREHPSPSSS